MLNSILSSEVSLSIVLFHFTLSLELLLLLQLFIILFLITFGVNGQFRSFPRFEINFIQVAEVDSIVDQNIAIVSVGDFADKFRVFHTFLEYLFFGHSQEGGGAIEPVVNDFWEHFLQNFCSGLQVGISIEFDNERVEVIVDYHVH